ncbi:MAG: hypothetical protein NXH95_22340 [Pseudomonadaceae bacterium]|nr:hypothetical protein [Pseudomonadaceae bacterium]
MVRVLVAMILAPTLVAFAWAGFLGIVVLPFMLAAVAIVALPCFLIFRKFGWLNWWHAALVGLLGGVGFALIESGRDFDQFVIPNTVIYLAVGLLTGCLGWFLGIFRNSDFPNVSADFPLSFLLIVPVIFLMVWTHDFLERTRYTGRVVEIVIAPTNEQSGEALVELVDGDVVSARLSNTWPLSMVQDACFHVSKRWSVIKLGVVFELLAPFGVDRENCVPS